jgi:Ran GTPase-activating protein (RanGAP) involved in mRNA processing and transport
MSGGKACGKQAAQYTGKQPDEGSVATSRDTAAAENKVHSSGHTHRKSVRLKEMSAAKHAGGKGETEKGKQPAVLKKRTRTTRHATQTQPLLLAADAPFVAALEAIPAEDWCMRLPAVVRLSRSFRYDARNGTAAEMLQFVMRQLTLMTGWCRITTLELRGCAITGTHAEWLAGGVLAQCRELLHLDLSENDIDEAGAERLAGVLGQCPALAHIDLSYNLIGPAGTESLAGVLAQCTALAHLDLEFNGIGVGGAERLAGVLAQCPALAHLNLSYNKIGGGGAEKLAGVLGQCPALVHLNLCENQIGNAGAESFAGVLAQCPELAHLDLRDNQIGPAGAGFLAGVLGHCAALTHLNLSLNKIGNAGADRLAGVLPQCAALAHLDVSRNGIGAVGKGRLRASWRGQASGLVL